LNGWNFDEVQRYFRGGESALAEAADRIGLLLGRNLREYRSSVTRHQAPLAEPAQNMVSITLNSMFGRHSDALWHF
jgi:hypothetical protein